LKIKWHSSNLAITAQGATEFSVTKCLLEDVVDVMSEEKRHQNTCDATNPKEKVLGQLRGIDLFLVHLLSVLLSIVSPALKNNASPSPNRTRTTVAAM
jgi:hypothetical protein